MLIMLTVPLAGCPLGSLVSSAPPSGLSGAIMNHALRCDEGTVKRKLWVRYSSREPGCFGGSAVLLRLTWLHGLHGPEGRLGDSEGSESEENTVRTVRPCTAEPMARLSARCARQRVELLQAWAGGVTWSRLALLETTGEGAAGQETGGGIETLLRTSAS